MGSAGLQAGSKKASAQRLPPAQQTVRALLAEVPRDDAIARRGHLSTITVAPHRGPDETAGCHQQVRGQGRRAAARPDQVGPGRGGDSPG